MSTLYGAGGLTGAHVPLPTGTITHRPAARRNTSPFPPRVRMTDAQRRRAQAEAARILAAADARRTGVSIEDYNARRRAERARTPKTRNGGRTRTWDLEQAIELYNSGLTLAQVGERLGEPGKPIPWRTIRSGLDGKVEPRRASYYRKPTFDVAALLADAPTHSKRELARKYGIDARTVGKHLSRAGVRAVDGRRKAS